MEVGIARWLDELDEEADISAGERTWKWMMGLAACEGTVIRSTLSRMARMVRTFSWRVERIEGVLRRMEMASEAEAASRAGVAAEKTKEMPLMRYLFQY